MNDLNVSNNSLFAVPTKSKAKRPIKIVKSKPEGKSIVYKPEYKSLYTDNQILEMIANSEKSKNTKEIVKADIEIEKVVPMFGDLVNDLADNSAKSLMINGLESYDRRFTKGWDSVVLKQLSFAIGCTNDSDMLQSIIEDTKNRFVVHYIGLFQLLIEVGYTRIEYKDFSCDLTNLIGFEEAKGYKGLKSWTLVKQVDSLDSMNVSDFKTQHLIRLSNLVYRLESVKLS